MLKYILIFCLSTFLFLSFSYQVPKELSEYELVMPSSKKVRVNENQLILTLRINPKTISQIDFYLPWDTTFVFDMASPDERKLNNKKILDHLSNSLILNKIESHIEPFHQPVILKADTFSFSSKRLAFEVFGKDTNLTSVKIIREQQAVIGHVKIYGWKQIKVDIEKREKYCKGDYVSVPVLLTTGLNKIPFIVYNNKTSIIDSVSIYYSLEIENKKPPEDFTNSVFHGSLVESKCQVCHSKEKFATELNTTSSSCKLCHVLMNTQKFIHGPVSSEECEQCHNRNNANEFKLVYTSDKEKEICFQCHSDIQEITQTKKFVHAPVVSNHCTICHSPHASKYEFQLRIPTNQICLACHDDKKEGNHPVVFHPFQSRKDPSNPNKELTCVSCHNPHGADNNNLLRGDGGYFQLCQSCHNK